MKIEQRTQTVYTFFLLFALRAPQSLSEVLSIEKRSIEVQDAINSSVVSVNGCGTKGTLMNPQFVFINF